MSDRMMDRLNETPVTYGILLVYLTMAYLTGSLGMDLSGELLVKHGAAAGILIADGEIWRLLSSAFLHANIVHLVLNSYAVLILGPPLERYLHTGRFIVLYIVAALFGSLLALLTSPEYFQMVGGSGAVFGMLGALLALNIRGGRTLLDFLENHGARQLIGIIVINLAIGLVIPIISNSAHIGGLIGGFVLVFCFYDIGRRAKVDKIGKSIQAGWIVLVLCTTLYAMHPVLRFDYTLKQYLQEPDSARRRSLEHRLQIYDDLSEMQPWDRARYASAVESDPRTGIQAVAHREKNVGRLYTRTIRRWKRDG